MPSEVTLELRIGEVTPDKAPREVVEALLEVNVNSAATAQQPSGFELKFAAGRSSLVTTRLLPSGYFDPPRRVVISVMFRGVSTVLMDGVITQQDVVPSDSAGQTVLSVKGEDLTRMMDVVDLTGFPYPATAAELRVLIMIAKYTPVYKVMPLVMPSVLIDVPDPLSDVPVQRGTDLTYIKQLAERVGYTFFLVPGPLPGVSLAYWGPSLRAAIPFLPKPTPFAIDWDGRSNIDSLQFSFDGFKKTQFIVWIKVPTVPIPLPIPVPDINPLSPPLGAKSPMPLKISSLKGLSRFTPLQAAGIALARAAESANVISGSGTLDVLRYGEILNARTVVQVRGAGITYDGDYFVESVSHAIKPGSYTQSFTLRRNALIAGTGSPLDALSYGLSAPQQLSGFASAAQNAASPPLPGLPAPPLPLPAAPPLPASPTGGMR